MSSLLLAQVYVAYKRHKDELTEVRIEFNNPGTDRSVVAGRMAYIPTCNKFFKILKINCDTGADINETGLKLIKNEYSDIRNKKSETT